MNLSALLASLPQHGTVEWIGVRPSRRVAMEVVPTVAASAGHGLDGDRYAGRGTHQREVTLIQAEHLEVLAQLLGRNHVDPALLRRNIVVRGINLLALNGARFRIGTALLQGTGGCHPCSRMEEALGPGGYNAMRGHGGITARIVESGQIRIGDSVKLVEAGTLCAQER